MAPFRNLVSDSILVTETIRCLEAAGGRASAVSIVDRVMKIRKPDPSLACLLVRDLVERDSRLAMIDDHVEMLADDEDALQIDQADFVVFDLETTGAKAPPCRITEIGAFRISRGAVVDEFHTLVNPETPIPRFITGLTGISDEMVKDAPVFRDVADRLLDFIGDSVLVAHNSRFDMAFLNYEIGRIYQEYRLKNRSLCTVQLSRRLLPDIQNHKLNTVAQYFSIDLVNHHRARDDAHATAHIFVNFLADLCERGIRDLGSARRFSVKKMRR